MKTNCPDCKKEAKMPDKTWKYGLFVVQSYTCENCKTHFREYIKDGKHAFTLKREKGTRSGLRKV